MAKLLTTVEVTASMAQCPHWQLAGNAIVRELKFKGFVEAIAFVNQLVEPAEAAGHHPDLAISYNRVTITLSTHDAGGLTANDFALAQVIDVIASA
ncbi:4a-hydroxytetrahydrobiopterin dehydratase [Spirulina sp. CCNP1310]|uniref:4a-hydroxytetrahydrobiopterin dehydratase n=1 Tax=Spirulina sp. CCNP1310 TaxID=3110249 RepID=UPI002B1FE7F3|nr:4a-hydroxytetrahydrobiopterin dehydratase [Spirulina sp. CCNP1310]MEA5418597.1 4a-hydroxytetrahydrobiopterin dehydratase [Spirulina sp. CCNP1310]